VLDHPLWVLTGKVDGWLTGGQEGALRAVWLWHKYGHLDRGRSGFKSSGNYLTLSLPASLNHTALIRW